MGKLEHLAALLSDTHYFLFAADRILVREYPIRVFSPDFGSFSITLDEWIGAPFCTTPP
jgi:hypothetical protein